MLRHSRCRMPQHLSYIRKRNIVGQRNNGGERVPGGMSNHRENEGIIKKKAAILFR